MNSIVLEVPDKLYKELQDAQTKLSYPDIKDLALQAIQRYIIDINREDWNEEFKKLQKEVRRKGGLKLGYTKEEIIESLRKERNEIFEKEYANLYR